MSEAEAAAKLREETATRRLLCYDMLRNFTRDESTLKFAGFENLTFATRWCIIDCEKDCDKLITAFLREYPD